MKENIIFRVGAVADIGLNKVMLERYIDVNFEKIIDAYGMCVLPGFIDAHTHPIWSGDRVHEFALKVSNLLFCNDLFNDCKSD